MPFSQEEFTARITKLKQHLVSAGIDLAILNQNSDIFYYTGSFQPLYVIVPAVGNPVMLARKAIDRIGREVSHLELEVFQSARDMAEIFERRGFLSSSTKRIGMTLDSISYSSASRFERMFHGVDIADLSWEIRTLRMVKSEAEISVISQACKSLSGITNVAKDVFRPDISEMELSAEIEHYLRMQGHGGLVRCRREGIEMAYGLCSSGLNTLVGTNFEGICSGAGLSPGSPYGGSYSVIEKGAPLLLDYALTLDGYHSDYSRIVIWGEPSDEIKRAYDAMVEVEQRVFVSLVPGATCEDVYNISLEAAKQLGYEEEYMGYGSEKVRFVGHGVGLELDEPPFLAPKMKDTLAENMVLAIEPKVMLPGIGIVGIEDTVVVRSNGIEILTDGERGIVVVG